MSTEKDYVKFLQDQGECILFNSVLYNSTGTQFWLAHHIHFMGIKNLVLVKPKVGL